MQSLKELYKIGNGPSSSHTMGPQKAAQLFKAKNPEADGFKAILYGSLALTGKGHRTDYIIAKTFAPLPTEIVFDRKTPCTVHPNTLDLYALKDDRIMDFWRVYSIGGGTIKVDGVQSVTPPEIYPLNTFKDIARYCKSKKIRLWQYVEEIEGKEIWDFLRNIWKVMTKSIRDGLSTEGTLPGPLKLQRKAKAIYLKRQRNESQEITENRLVSAYAYAVNENNAASGVVVTAPTCGASGVLPAVLFYRCHRNGHTETEILHALATAGLVGNIIKTNASISGSECGCQAEIGSACSMTAAAISELDDQPIDIIEYAAEIAMEHHLGLTCDPVKGVVQIPCIERNAVAAMRAINAENLASLLNGTRRISFDTVIKTMYNTGRDLSEEYRETSEGGLAEFYDLPPKNKNPLTTKNKRSPAPKNKKSKPIKK